MRGSDLQQLSPCPPTPTPTPPSRQILARQSVRWDDQRGPAALVGILLAVFALSYVLALMGVF